MVKTSKEAQQSIKKWLAEEKIPVKDVEDSDSAFHYEVDFPVGRGMKGGIFQPKDNDGRVLTYLGVRIAPELRKRLDELPPAEKSEFLWDLRFQLLFLENSFNMKPSAEKLERIEFMQRIFYEDLTKSSLFRALELNHKAALSVGWAFQRKLGQ